MQLQQSDEPILTENSRKLLARRYLVKNESGEVVETPTLRYERVAAHVASGEPTPEQANFYRGVYYTLMAQGLFLPNTPCLANAGRPDGFGQLSACFVLPVKDSMESIFTTLAHMALIHKSGGGTGFAFSQIRPALDFVRSTTGVASGPVPFMEAYSNVTECIKQAGMRRGANMGVLRVDHPDILAFIECKRTGRIQNFNISVAITNAFMDALLANKSYALVNPRTGEIVGQLQARAVWARIVECAWFNGDPGMIFIDRVNELDPLTEALGPIEATNPCGEVPLRAYDACTLGSINLGKFYSPQGNGKYHGTIDKQRLLKTVAYATRFLDDVLTVCKFPLPEITARVQESRKIGLGCMGWADLLAKLHVPYSSDRALELAREVQGWINQQSIETSEELAVERGPFPAWAKSKRAKLGYRPRRNSTTTVIAPTGSISIIAGCSSGIEPFFALSMIRNQAEMEMLDVNEDFLAAAKENGFYSEALVRKLAERGTCKGMDEVPEYWQGVFETTWDIAPEQHVRMQAAFQASTQDAVSKTINLPNDATQADVERAYTLAWQLGCKGITVYRDKSKQNQVLNVGAVNKSVVEPPAAMASSPVAVDAPRRVIPDDGRRVGETISKKTAYGTVHVTINKHPTDSEPFEVFVSLGKSGREVTAMMEALGRAVSYALSIPSSVTPSKRLEALAEQFAQIGGGSSVGLGEHKIVSAPDGVARAFAEYLHLKAPEGAAIESTRPNSGFDVCPQCGQAAVTKGGKCDLCLACGHSKC